jgi:hypothetical protein
MIDHKISAQTFNRIEWKAYLLIMNNIAPTEAIQKLDVKIHLTSSAIFFPK